MVTNQPNSTNGPENESDDLLDHALAAAFGSDADENRVGGGEHGRTILDRLNHRFGFHSQVLLRDSPEDEAETIMMPAPGGDAGSTGGLDRRYQVFGEIARGGMGVVLKGRDINLGRDVAIKVLQPNLASRAEMVQRFVEEAQIAGQLQHPGILPVYELGLQHDERPYFAMRLIKGRTLAELLDDRANAEEDRARLLKTFEQVCQTVAYAHTRGVVHRDLKPANVMVGAFGEVQVVDWGLAKVIRHAGAEHAPARKHQTKIETVRTDRPGSASLAGSVMGTPGYMSPEQARGEVDSIDERADVYALGAILYEILTCAPPAAHVDDCDTAALSENLREHDADDDLADLALRCLAKRAADRPRTARNVADGVSHYLASLERRAHDAEVAAAEERTRAAAERHRRRLAIALAAIVVLATIGASLGIGWAWQDHQQRRAEAWNQLNVAITEAGERFGAARATRLHNDEAWTALDTAAQRVRGLIETVGPDSEIAQRAHALLADIEQQARQRHLAVTVENVVIYGATHYDADSWRAMERDLRGVLLEFGIDLDNMAKEEIARRIREDDATFELADGFELWLGTLGSLVEMGAIEMQMEEFQAWLQTLLDADPDPLRRRVRELVYGALFMQPVDRDEVARLFDSLDFEQVHPRTLSWLATVYFVVGDVEQSVDALRRITDVYPGDFMLMFDAAFSCASLQQWEPAIRYYLRCLSIRADVPGIWRQLGTAYRHTGELGPSLDALDRSIELDPQHGPTYVDRAYTQLERGERDEAIADAERGMAISDTAEALAWFIIGRAHFEVGAYDEALDAFDNCEAAAPHDRRFNEPIGDWIIRTRERINAGGDDSPSNDQNLQPTKT